MNPGLFTIGYQGVSLEQMIETLTESSVSMLIDTRETPMSRRVEFRPAALEHALSAVGIAYLPARFLGAPRELRALAAVDWPGFADGYRDRLRLVREELERLVSVVAAERTCLLCFEADPGACHRSLLAHEIQRLLDIDAVHLLPRRPNETDDLERPTPLREVADDEVKVPRG